MTSDEFFRITDQTFDLIFIDGLHHADQVLRDIENALEVLNEGGVIVCHDMSPMRYHLQAIPHPNSQIPWNGDCWKAWMHLRRNRSDLWMAVVDNTTGCGVIRKGEQQVLKDRARLTFRNLKNNRKKWLNLMSIEDFLKSLPE